MSLAEELLGKNGAEALAKSAGLAKRVHRIDDDEEEVVVERDDKGHAKAAHHALPRWGWS